MANEYPKITIITPSFNQGEFIEETICSVLDQQYSKLEYLVFDGGSTDNTLEVLKKYDKYITYWESIADKGQSHAINKGLKKASGDIVNWLNSDDYYEPDALNTVGRFFTEHPSCQVLCGRSNLVQEGKVVKLSTGTDVYTESLAKTIGWARIDQPETFFRKSTIDRMGSLNSGFHYVMDKEWWVRFLLLFGLEHVEKVEDVWVNFRLHQNSKTVSQTQLFEQESIRLYYELARQFGLSKYSSFLKKLLNDNANIEQAYIFSGIFQAKVDVSLVEKAINYYLLYLADLFYYRHERDKIDELLLVIEDTLLAPQDRLLYRKIKFRSSYLPVWLVKGLRKSV